MVNVLFKNKGETNERPINVFDTDAGHMYFDTTLNKPVWWDGKEWIDYSLDRESIIGSNSEVKSLGYKVLSSNKSFAEQVTKANMIYEIRYNFDIGGGKFIIPENCTLNFVGGKITNGTIVGNKTTVIAGKNDEIFSNVKIEGSFTNEEINVCWFGAKSTFTSGYTVSKGYNSLTAIQSAMDVDCYEGFSTVFFPVGAYYITNTIVMSILKNMRLEGEAYTLSLDKKVFSNSSLQSACIYTDKDIDILNIDLVKPKYHAEQGGNWSLFIVGGQFDVSLAGENYSKSVFYFTDKNEDGKHMKLWGVTLESTITGSVGLLRNETATGKAIYFDFVNGGFATMIRSKCNIQNFPVGITDSVFENSSWVTDILDESVITCRCAIRIHSAYSCRWNGSYQSAVVYPVTDDGENEPGIIELYSEDHTVEGKIWDVNQTSNSDSTKRTTKYGVIIGCPGEKIKIDGLARSTTIKGNYISNELEFNLNNNIFNFNTVSNLEFKFSGLPIEVSQPQNMFKRLGATIIKFDRTLSGGTAEIDFDVPLDFYPFIAIKLSPTHGHNDSFEEVELVLMQGDTVKFSQKRKNYKYFGSNVYKKEQILFSIKERPQSYINHVKIILHKPITFIYGAGAACYIEYIIGNSERYKSTSMDITGRGATKIFSSDSNNIALAFNNYTNESLDEEATAIGSKYYTAINMRNNDQLTYVRQKNSWGIIQSRDELAKEIGGWGIPAFPQEIKAIESGGTPYHIMKTSTFEDAKFKKTYFLRRNRWEEIDGAAAGVKRNGATSDRPVGNDIYVGFVYFDTSLNKPVWWNGSVWVDSAGTTV